MLSRLSSTACSRATLKVYTIPKNVSQRSVHSACAARNGLLRNNVLLTIRRLRNSPTDPFIRCASTNDGSPADFLDEIPDPPLPPTLLDDAAEAILKYHDNGEPTLCSLGLGSYWPSGLIQSSLEYLHINLDIPWWQAIVLGTLVIRTCMFPLIIRQQKLTAKQTELLPQFQKLQREMQEAATNPDIYEQARVRQKYASFVYEKGFNPLKSLPLMLVQMIVMGSNFFALRGMANLPVESLKEGGLWWFKDLTIYDPYYILPVITCATLLVTIELGTEFTHPGLLGNAKYFIRAVPIVVFLFTLHFPSALLCYWTTSNFFALVQAGLLRTTVVRNFLKLPEIKIPKTNGVTKVADESFVQQFKNTYDNYKVSRNMVDRARLDRMQLQEAGRGPLPKTYKYNPIKDARVMDNTKSK